MRETTIIESIATTEVKPRPAGKKKKNLQRELLVKSLQTLQYVAPKLTSSIIWNQFTKTPRPKFNDKQKELVQTAEVSTIQYMGCALKAYRWLPTNPGPNPKKVLLAHGWGSKIADFRKMIGTLRSQGYVVEGIDMKAHGSSEGTHTALPEMRDVLKNYYVKEGPFHAVVGYSIGGLAAGITINELGLSWHPKHLVIIATPPYTRYFFKEIIEQVGCTDKVYEEMCEMVYEHYFQPIDYFDLRTKADQLKHLDIHLVYDEHDKTVPFSKALELTEVLPSRFVHVKGTDHNKIIADEKVIGYIAKALEQQEVTR